MQPYFEANGAIIYQGDVLDVLRELPDNHFDLVMTSPPYNCRKPYDGVSDEMPWPDYYAWMRKVLKQCYRVLLPGGTIALNVPSVVKYQPDHAFHETWTDFDPEYKWLRNGEKRVGRGRTEPIGFKLYFIMQSIDRHMREPMIWVKGAEEGQAIAATYLMGSDSDPLLRPAHEMVLLGSKQRWYHRGGTGRRGEQALPYLDFLKDVQHVAPVTNREHPATWPAALPERMMKIYVHAKDGKILDPFMGIGTTLAVARDMGLQGVGIDVSPKYCEMAARWLSQSVLFDFARS